MPNGAMPEIPEILKLAGLDVTVVEAAQKLGKLVQDGTTFAQVNVAPANLIPPLPLTGQDTVVLDDARFSVGGSFNARLTVGVFNEVTDKDDDQILQLAAGEAALRYALTVDIKGSAGGKIGNLGFGLDASLGASLLSYRAHRPAEEVGKAMIADLASFRLPLRLSDVQALEKGDILACTVRGMLALHARLTVADVLTAALPSLDDRLGVAGASAIKLDVGAAVAMNLSVEDDYRLIFRRGAGAGTTRVEVRRAKGRTVAGSAGLTVAAAVADPAGLQKALTAYATGRLGEPWERVKNLIDRIDAGVNFQDLTADERAVAQQVGMRLGLTDLRTRWQNLKDRLLKLPADLSSKLEDALKTRVEAAVKLEYSRVSDEQLVLGCVLNADALARHHGELLLGNLTGVLGNLAAQKPGYELVKYLNSETITRKISFGFSLSIGHWAASGKDEILKIEGRQTDFNERHERLSFAGRRTYAANWGGKTYKYAFGLDAAMGHFSASGKANASEFDYSLSFGWNWREPLTASLVSGALDLANVWTVLSQRENDANLDAVLTQVSGTALIEVEVQISDGGVRSLLGVPRSAFEAAWIEAMAASLPRAALGNRIYRARLKDRVRVYGRAARVAFENIGGVEIAAIAGVSTTTPARSPTPWCNSGRSTAATSPLEAFRTSA